MQQTPRFITNTNGRQRLLWLAVTLLACLPVLFPLLHVNLWGTDRFFNEIRLVELARCLQDGVWWPRWMPDLAHGHGSPLPYYYPMALYYLAYPLFALGLDPRQALLLILGAAMALGSFSVFGLLRSRVGATAAALGAVLWFTAPYLQVNLQVRHAWTELLGLGVIPLFLWGVLDLAEGSRQLESWLRTVLGLALLLLTHNVIGLFGLGLAALAVVFAAVGENRKGRLRRLAAALGLGLGLSAFFWLPAFVDRGLVNVNQMSEGLYAFAQQGVYPSQLFGISFGRGASIPGPNDLMSLTPGLVHVLAFLTLLGAAFVRPRRLGRLSWSLFGLLVLLSVLMFPFAAPAFEWVPMLGHVQAPFRLLGPIGCLVAIAIPLVGSRVIPAKWRLPTGTLLAIASIGLLLPAFMNPRPMTPAEWSEYEPVRQEGFEGIPRLADPWTTTTVFREYQPQSVPHYPIEMSTALVEAPPWVRIDDSHKSALGVFAEGIAEQPSVLRVNVFDFPGFEANINGVPVAHKTDPATGFVLVPLATPGPWSMSLVRESTTLALGAGLLSLLSLLLAAVVLIRRIRALHAEKTHALPG